MVSVTKTNSTKINIRMKNNPSIRITITKKKASRMTRTTKISTQTQTTTIRMDMVMIRLIIRIHFTNNPLTILIRTQMEALTIRNKPTTTTIALQKRTFTTVGADTTVEMVANMEETKPTTVQRTTMEATTASMRRVQEEREAVAVE